MATREIALLQHPEDNAKVTRCLERAGHEVVILDPLARAEAIFKESTFDLFVSNILPPAGAAVPITVRKEGE